MAYKLGKRYSDEGEWFDAGEGAKLLLARAGNDVYKRELERLKKPHNRRINNGTFSASENEKLHYQAMARGIILDWKGVQAEDGTDIPYDSDLGAQMLEDDPVLLGEIADFVADIENFRIKKEKETVKK